MMKKILLMSIYLLSCFIVCNAQSNKQIAHASPTETASDLILKNVHHNAFEELYDDWNNDKCHAKSKFVPTHYTINIKQFAMPIQQQVITSKFGKRWGRNHNGIDIKAYQGDTIYAAFCGKVRVVKNDPRGYGNVIVIRHWNGLETVYGHLSKQIVKINEIVNVGQPIGLAGNTGRSTGTHLHFETRFCGLPINPLEIFSFTYNDVTGDIYQWVKRN